MRNAEGIKQRWVTLIVLVHVKQGWLHRDLLEAHLACVALTMPITWNRSV